MWIRRCVIGVVETIDSKCMYGGSEDHLRSELFGQFARSVEAYVHLLTHDIASSVLEAKLFDDYREHCHVTTACSWIQSIKLHSFDSVGGVSY